MIHTGDCIEVMRGMEAESVDAVVTDPPYGLEFMGKEWDSLRPGINRGGQAPGRSERQADKLAPVEYGGAKIRTSFRCDSCGKSDKFQNSHACTEPTWTRIYLQPDHGGYGRAMQHWHEQWATEAFRVLKPGGYLLAFGGTRTYHRLASAIEDAGFEIRDTLMWIYASGFPKSLDVSKALDKVAGAEREVVGRKTYPDGKPVRVASADSKAEGWRRPWMEEGGTTGNADITAPATDLARKWEGWGTALKPAHEPIVMARKPLIGTVAQNVTRYGTGALNIDGSRIGTDGGHEGAGPGPSQGILGEGLNGQRAQPVAGLGRWPSNVLLSSPELFDEPNPGVVGSGATARSAGDYPVHEGWTGEGYGGQFTQGPLYEDSGGYSRFFIIPKADRAERERGLAGFEKKAAGLHDDDNYRQPGERKANHTAPMPRANTHPTVKPLDLMRHLVRLVTPIRGTVLDPFLGSGTTAIAAEMEGFAWIGIEREPEYVAIAEGRLNGVQRGLGLDVPAPTKRPPKTHPDLSKHQPKRRAPAENWTGGWAGTTLLGEDAGRVELPDTPWPRCVAACVHYPDSEPVECACGVPFNEEPAA